MHIIIAAVAKKSRGPEMELYEEYVRRLKSFGWTVDLKLSQVKKNLSGALLQKAEAELVLPALDKTGFRVALDEKGKSLTSRQFADYLKTHEGQRGVFVIGGADGLDPSILSKVSLRLAFGAQTWPHRLVLPMLAEQLYRAATLLSGHPYHRD